MTNRLTNKQITLSVGTTTWTAPAGVTVVHLFSRSSVTPNTEYPGTFIRVVPNTTYTITTVDTSWDTTGDSATFGSLLTFPSSTRLLLNWVE